MTRMDKIDKILTELIKPENWQPNLSKISRKTGFPVSTVFDNIKVIRDNKLLEIHTEVRLRGETYGTKKNRHR